jgi:hypothetical protein
LRKGNELRAGREESFIIFFRKSITKASFINKAAATI